MNKGKKLIFIVLFIVCNIARGLTVNATEVKNIAKDNMMERELINIRKEKYVEKYGVSYEQLFSREYIINLNNKADTDIYQRIFDDMYEVEKSYASTENKKMMAWLYNMDDPANIWNDTVGFLEGNSYEKYRENVLEALLVEIINEDSINYTIVYNAIERTENAREFLKEADEIYIEELEKCLDSIYYNILTKQELECVLNVYLEKQENDSSEDVLKISSDVAKEILNVCTLMSIQTETIDWLIKNIPRDNDLKQALKKYRQEQDIYFSNHAIEYINNLLREQLWKEFDLILKDILAGKEYNTLKMAEKLLSLSSKLTMALSCLTPGMVQRNWIAFS